MPIDQPGVRLSIGGVPVPGIVSVEIESLGYYAADRFRIELALGAAPLLGAAYLSATPSQIVTVEIATDGIGYVSLLTGQIDNARVDFLTRLVTLTGRDLSARLIDTELAETFVNLTSSQIASTLALRHQLAANVTPTTTPVGQYYELDHARSGLGLNSRSTTEWNLLSDLAKLENFDLFVTGTTLNFGPPVTSVGNSWSIEDFIALSVDKAMTLPTAATVKSWNTRQKAVISETTGSGASSTLVRPNLSPAQAQILAENHVSTLGRHGVLLHGVLPGDLTTSPGSYFTLTGTNSIFDQAYAVSVVSRSVSSKTGFRQAIFGYAVN